MKEEIKNQDRFNILRGYYNNKGFHSMGRREVDLNNLLHQMDFNNLDNFIEWHKSLTPEEIEKGRKDWCPGNCCQSILIKLLKLGKIGD